MEILARLEELTVLLLSIYLFSQLPFSWWVFPVFFFVPDASLIGYLAGKHIGAVAYNLFHHKAVAIGAYLSGSLLGIPLLSLVGVLLLGHSSFDRVLGLGLMDTGSPEQAPLRSIGQKA